MSKKALLIGINYKNTKAALRGCINDVLNTKKVLQEKFGYEEKNITILTEESSILPTCNNIKRQMSKMAAEAEEGDTLYFHYSGHGSFIRDFDGDEVDRLDEVILPLDFKTAGIISDDWMYANFVRKIPKGVKVFCVLDCCHSGTGMDLQYNFQFKCPIQPNPLPEVYLSEEWKENYEMVVQNTKYPTDGLVCSFSGCADIQTSADAYIKQIPQGAFTACFLEILKSERAQEYTLKEILKEVNCRLIMYRMTQRSQLSVARKEDCDEKLYI